MLPGIGERVWYRVEEQVPQAHERESFHSATFVKPRLNCDLDFVKKGSRKQPRPLLEFLSWAATQSLMA